VINPWSSTIVGSIAGGVLSSAVGQVGGNLVGCRADIWNVDWNLAAVSGVGAGAGRAIGTYISIPNRSATSFVINQRMGPTPQAAVESTAATIRGGSSGFAQYGYKGAFYPSGYPQNMCGCSQ
jgi:hypothetical protein